MRTVEDRLARIRQLATTFEDGQLDANEVRRLCGEAELPVQSLETANEWFVTAHGGLVVLQHLPSYRFSPDTAIRLASWLIVAAELADSDCSRDCDALDVAIATVRAVRNT